jgi:hypothetical protein
MKLNLQFILSLSAIIPAVIGLVRIKNLDKPYLPFLLCMWLGLVTELLDNWVYYGLLQEKGSSAYISNIYLLFELYLLGLMFYLWGFFKPGKYIFPIMLAALTILWGWDNLIHKSNVFNPITQKDDIRISLFTYSSYFRVSYSVVFLVISLIQIQRLVLKKGFVGNINIHPFKTPILLICIGMVIFYTFKILVEAIYNIDMGNGQDAKDIKDNIFDVVRVGNVITNLIFGLAMWRAKKRFHG